MDAKSKQKLNKNHQNVHFKTDAKSNKNQLKIT